MKIAVVILNYNSFEDCRKCASFLKQQKNVDLELVFIDNHSSDGYIVKDLCDKEGFTFIQNKENNGYNAGNNIGLRYAANKGYEYVMIANPDMEFPETDYISKLISAIDIDKDIVVVGSKILTQDGVYQNPKKRENPSLKHSFDWLFSFLFHRKKNDEWVDNPEESHFCKCLNGCCFLIKIDFLREINFFDEETFLYGEEPILGRQVELASKKLYYTTETYAIHNHIKSKESNRNFCFKHWKKSMIIYIEKYSHLNCFEKYIYRLSISLYFICLSIYSKIKKR